MERLIDINSSPVANYLDILLKDMTTGKNIIWATDAYLKYGEDFGDKNQLFAKALLGAKSQIIRPRIEKSMEEQQERTKKKAEVFTPSWLCNEMNNYCDEEWFGRKDVFNIESEDHTWIVNENKIEFSNDRNWKDYVTSTRLEITCGEAPFLVSRYDSSTGDLILPPLNRIGILDRKLRVVNENTTNEKEWQNWTEKAYQATYGYEYQGDNLLIARVNLLLTYYDYYKERFDKDPDYKEVQKIAKIITWNIWQMDGLLDTVPLGKPFVNAEQISLFDEQNENTEDISIPCKIKDWKTKKIITFKECKEIR